MANDEHSVSIPLTLIVLDVIGMLLVVIGLLGAVADIDILPEGLRFQGYEVACIFAGFVLMAPLMIHIASLVIRRARTASNDGQPG